MRVGVRVRATDEAKFNARLWISHVGVRARMCIIWVDLGPVCCIRVSEDTPTHTHTDTQADRQTDTHRHTRRNARTHTDHTQITHRHTPG